MSAVNEIAGLIHAAGAELVRFLEVKLPVLSERWWEVHVYNRLTFQQQRTVQERGFSGLGQLDMAALLRVFDQNWHELSEKFGFAREGRHWVKEMITVRNRWAHMGYTPPRRASCSGIWTPWASSCP